jgi:hypothetical protein
MLGTLTLKEKPTLGDLIAIENAMRGKSDVERLACTIARLAGLDRTEVEQLDLVDYEAIIGLDTIPKGEAA